ncbi:MAG: hypothetical protein FWC28_00275 [Proteobacteria bacterium]|nr:hypothetical protein [Cystobacterineae bacterium]MCL2313678.1 hypothetical protein [Pseudomonadota bacterium]
MDVERQILLCIQSLSLPKRLAPALDELRQHPSERAQLVVALLELEHARRGSMESKAKIPQIAELLLRAWRNGKPAALLKEDPTLLKLWDEAVVLLKLFEAKRLSKQLNDCWDAREDAPRLKAAVTALSPPGHRRVEFAICLYSLQLVRLGIQEAECEFHRRVLLLKEAFFSPALASQLQGSNIGLSQLWQEVQPILTHYFSHAASKSQEFFAPLAFPTKTTSDTSSLPVPDETSFAVEFWRHAEEQLGLFPLHVQKAIKPRTFVAELPEGRERLGSYMAEAKTTFSSLPVARTFFSMLHLLLAANSKGEEHNESLQIALEYFPQKASLLAPIVQLLTEGDSQTQEQLFEGWLSLARHVEKWVSPHLEKISPL